jgi:GNAT superfamily N-acetyltransferase
MRSHEFMEIARIPQGDFGDKDTLAPMSEPRGARPLPGGSGYTYAVQHDGNLKQIMIFDKNALIAELDVRPTGDVFDSYRVESVATDPDYRGQGLGLALYGIALSVLKLTLRAGETQTRHGRAMWLKLNSIPGVEVRGLAREPREEYTARPEDQIVQKTSKYITYTFPVTAGTSSMRGTRSGRGIYGGNATMIAQWTGQ